jgi:hypothetical protein
VKANGAFLGKRPETPSFGAVALLGIKSGLLRLRLLALRTVDRPGDFLGSFFDLFLENFDCFFQLGVFPVGKVIGGDIDDDMGDCSVEFHVFTILREEPAAARETHTAEIEDVGRTGRDDSSGGWDSHDFTTIQSLDGVEKDLGVGEGIFVAENDDRLGPAGVDVSVLRVTDVTVAPHGVGVQRMGENGEKVVRRESLIRNRLILERLGCIDETGMIKLRKGNAPTITMGPYAGEIVTGDHIIPRSVCPELDNTRYNLEMIQCRGRKTILADQAGHWGGDRSNRLNPSKIFNGKRLKWIK